MRKLLKVIDAIEKVVEFLDGLEKQTKALDNFRQWVERSTEEWECINDALEAVTKTTEPPAEEAQQPEQQVWECFECKPHCKLFTSSQPSDLNWCHVDSRIEADWKQIK